MKSDVCVNAANGSGHDNDGGLPCGVVWGNVGRRSGIAAVSLCRNDGCAASAESRFISAGGWGNFGNPAGNNTKCSPS